MGFKFFFLNVRRHFEDVTSDGRLFQVLAAATAGNARSPIVESRVSGTASAEVDDERRRCGQSPETPYQGFAPEHPLRNPTF